MAFWRFGRKRAAPESAEVDPALTPGVPLEPHPAPRPEPAQSAPSAKEPELLVRARGLSFERAVDEALAAQLLSEARDTPLEARVLEIVQRTLSAGPPFGQPIVAQLARIWVDRGELARAEALAEQGGTAELLFLASELAEARGEWSLALSRLERVLARAVDYPGARERHRRLRRSLGLEQVRTKHIGATALVPQAEAPYRLLREVARGGAGAVYEAEDPALLRLCALKMLHDPNGQAQAIAREMQLLAKLAGPGVLRIYDVDLEAGWLAFEWAAGGSLRQRLRRSPPELGALQRWLPKVLRALGRVHAAGYVHGDIKPANLLFLQGPGADDEPVWSDFGLAVPIGAPLVGGSPGYMSPDRGAAVPARPWHDRYGLGRTLEELAASAGCPAALRPRLSELARRCLEEPASASLDVHALADWFELK